MLRAEEPQDLMTPPETYPAENSRRETSLRNSLMALATKPPADAIKAVLALETDHAWRR
jgi:hypothetical protein